MFGTVKVEREEKKWSKQNSMKQDCTRELFPKCMGRIESLGSSKLEKFCEESNPCEWKEV